MTEAVTAITQFAFQQLKARRVEIRCDAENLASKKIPERLSFKLEARLHGDDVKVHSDILRDTLVFARFDDRDLPDVGARWNTSELIRVNHVQITVPKNAEDEAKSFYCGFLGLIEIPKPDNLKGRGGFWMQLSDTQVHVGAEDGVERQATKAHIAYEVADLNCWSRKLRDRGIEILDGIPVPGIDRFEFRDPFGNRVEFLQRRKASEHDSL